MKAIVYDRYGPPEVLRLAEMEKPTPGEGDVLVRIQAASVGAGDWHLMRGDPFLVRLMFGLRRPKHPVLGSSISGLVEAVGKGVTRVRPGDEVFGDLSDCGFGGFAEYVSVPETALAPKPAGTTFEEAAAVPGSALPALQGLRDKGRIRTGTEGPGQRRLGGSGHLCGPDRQVFRGGGDRSLQHQECGNGSFSRRRPRHRLHEGGLCPEWATVRPHFGRCSLSPPPGPLPGPGTCRNLRSRRRSHGADVQGDAVRTPDFQGDEKNAAFFISAPNQEDLVTLKGLVESKQVTPVIDRRYPLSEVPEAIRYVETGHARGKVVIHM